MRIEISKDKGITEISYIKPTEEAVNTLCDFIKRNKSIIKAVKIIGK